MASCDPLYSRNPLVPPSTTTTELLPQNDDNNIFISAGKDADTVASFLNRKLAELEEQRKEEESKYVGENEDGWGILPDLILEKVFSYLTIQERFYASCACRQWYRAFHFQRPWSNILMNDTTLCRRKYDYGQRAYRYMLDHYRTRQLISHVGHHIRSLTLEPKSFSGLFAHYHFLNHISSHAERYRDDPGSVQGCNFKIRSFRFTFCCDLATRSTESYVIGTGGDILSNLTRSITNLSNSLLRLDLIDLLLVPEDAIHLLDEACSSLSSQLRTLTLINLTKDHFSILHPGTFINLQFLYISPQNLSEEMVEMLGENVRKLKELHLVQNSYTGFSKPVDEKAWGRVSFKIFLRTKSKEDKEVVWQEGGNVVSIIYDCPQTRFSTSSVVTIINLYSVTLREFGHLGLPKFRSSRSFVKRIDPMLISMCRKCPNLKTLYIRDRISTSTALLVVTHCPNLRNFHIRRNALLKKIDFMFHLNLHLDYNFTQWITFNAKSYEKTTWEIGKILGDEGWRALSDREFKGVCGGCAAY